MRTYNSMEHNLPLRFFDDLERKRSRAMEARNASEEKALEGFRTARTRMNLIGTVQLVKRLRESVASHRLNALKFIRHYSQ